MKISVQEAVDALRTREGKTFIELFRRNGLSVEIYQPEGQDLQTPHQQDELYIIISGNGVFQDGGERYPFGPGDLIFVPAHREHRFLDFSDDFKTWVIFF
jgi:mannose-6-phosphate isomerase-like protein (cupin superfamily)